ncbi:hypothetical protein G7046_g9526 [Stylonectria norvegica]|nr:hypothetical protein G7046_g9526 [Stylonectria norvegica]
MLGKMAQEVVPKSYRPKPVAARLRELLSSESRITICPGVYDGLTARIALREGSNASIVYMTGAGTATSRLGMPDLGILTMNDMRVNAATIASLNRKVPLIADADTDYGGSLMVIKTVRSYITAGVAGLHLEDQILSKRCGHLLDEEIVDEATFLSRIKAEVIARDDMKSAIGEENEEENGDIVLIVRTGALQVLGFDEEVRRLEMAIKAEAYVAFLEGPTSVEQCEREV